MKKTSAVFNFEDGTRTYHTGDKAKETDNGLSKDVLISKSSLMVIVWNLKKLKHNCVNLNM